MTIINYDQRLVRSKNPYPKGPNDWKRFFSFNTDAKVIGIQYIVTALFFLLLGGLLGMLVRGELITPPSDLFDPTVYNGLYTCLLYTSPSPRDGFTSRMPSSA